MDSFKGLPGVLADSLPDKLGTKLIERYLSDSSRYISTFSSIEKLCYVGQRGMGALEYVPANKDIDMSGTSVEIDALTKLAYDVTYAYDKSNMWLVKHQMSINRKTENHNLDDILMSGKQMNISKAKALNIIEGVENAVAKWDKFAEQAEIKEEIYNEIKSNQVSFLK